MIHYSKRKFTAVFWMLFVIIFSVYSFIAGTIEKRDYIQVKGKVTAQVDVPEYYMYNGSIKTKIITRPEISYPIGDNQQTSFIARKSKMNTGETPTLLYSKTNPQDVKIYNWLFWLNYAVLIPSFLIACFIYSIMFITINKYGKKPEILPGELDPFVYREPEKLKV